MQFLRGFLRFRVTDSVHNSGFGNWFLARSARDFVGFQCKDRVQE
jgi:hypothetical protein